MEKIFNLSISKTEIKSETGKERSIIACVNDKLLGIKTIFEDKYTYMSLDKYVLKFIEGSQAIDHVDTKGYANRFLLVEDFCFRVNKIDYIATCLGIKDQSYAIVLFYEIVNGRIEGLFGKDHDDLFYEIREQSFFSNTLNF
jgi:hypothetical protein